MGRTWNGRTKGGKTRKGICESQLKLKAIWWVVWKPDTITASWHINIYAGDLNEICKNGGDRDPKGHPLSPNKVFIFRNGLNLTDLLKMGSHGNPQKQFISCPPLTDAKAPLLKITPTQFIEHRETEHVPLWLASTILKLCILLWIKVQYTSPFANSLTYHGPNYKIHQYNGGTKIFGIINLYLVWLKTLIMRSNPHRTLLGWIRTWD